MAGGICKPAEAMIVSIIGPIFAIQFPGRGIALKALSATVNGSMGRNAYPYRKY